MTTEEITGSENVKAQESSSSRSSTVQPRYLIGVQHAPQSIGGLFSELFDFELVRVIEEDQEGSMENDNEISGKKFSNSVRENISLSDRVVKLKDTLVVEDCAGLSQDIIKLYSWRKSFCFVIHLPLSLVALESINIFKLLVMDLLIWMISFFRCNLKMLCKLMIYTEGWGCRHMVLRHHHS
ncbi:hypothetical protein P8452_28707 [Trifolium repens]|nr:hypothetical protein P8452_28707 [Trifolium repens]